MNCRICNNERMEIIYNGKMRRGGKNFLDNSKVYKCLKCGYIWHNEIELDRQYYETEQYRKEVDGSAKVEDYYRRADVQTLMKLEWTGTEIFRNKVVMDVGCAGGYFWIM